MAQELLKNIDLFDVALSFAGEDRDVVAQVAQALTRGGLLVFYDDEYRHSLVGTELTKVLRDVYYNRTRFCAVFISQHYAKFWPNNVERPTILERFFKTESQYLIPIRLDRDEWLEGLPETIGYVSATDRDAQRIAQEIVAIVGPRKVPRTEEELFEWLCCDGDFAGHFLVCFQQNTKREWYKWDGDTPRMWKRYRFGRFLEAYDLGTVSTNLLETGVDVILYLDLTDKGKRLLTYMHYPRFSLDHAEPRSI